MSNDQPPALTDEQAMRIALARAAAAGEAGEVPVGAVLMRDGQVLASGANAPVGAADPTAHAEIVALRAAAAAVGNYRLDGCTLYVTLEPCAMCAGAMLHARLARVVFGATEPRTGAAGSVLDLFAEKRLNHHTEVTGGVLADECGALLRSFFSARRQAQADAAEPLREDALRTPARAFASEAARAWQGRYIADLPALEGLRLHLLDLPGAVDDAPAFLCLHGPGDWGLRFASVAPVLAAHSQRVLVPDLIGFGRSDKPKREDFHRLGWHARLLADLCGALGLCRVVLVADAAEPTLADAVAAALGERSAGILLLDGPQGAPAADPSPFPDRGHAAGPRAFARGWQRAPSDTSARERIAFARLPQVLRLEAETPLRLRQAVEYFRG